MKWNIGKFLDDGKAIMGMDCSGLTGIVQGIVDNAANETAKAYGNCDRCYGKGYSTQMTGMAQRITLCACDRGKQFKTLLDTLKNKR